MKKFVKSETWVEGEIMNLGKKAKSKASLPSNAMVFISFFVMILSFFITHAEEIDCNHPQHHLSSDTVSWKCSGCGSYNSADKDTSMWHVYKCSWCGEEI